MTAKKAAPAEAPKTNDTDVPTAEAVQATPADSDAISAEIVDGVLEPKAPEHGSAAWRRADHIRALEEELDHVTRAGKSEDRIKGVEAALKKAKSAPRDRKAPESDEA